MTILIAPDPVPTGLRISAYRRPESGYARLVPDTWYRAASSPDYVSGPRLRTMNTGWGPIWEAGSNIGTGRTIRVPWISPDVASGGAGTVEVGGFYPLGSSDPDLWCCGPFQDGGTYCDANECAELDKEAAIEMAQDAGGGVVFDKWGAPVAVVTPQGEQLDGVDPGFVEAVTEVMELEELPAQHATPGKAKKKKKKGGAKLPPPPPSPTGDWPPPLATTQLAAAPLNTAVILGGLALVAGAWWFMRAK